MRRQTLREAIALADQVSARFGSLTAYGATAVANELRTLLQETT